MLPRVTGFVLALCLGLPTQAAAAEKLRCGMAEGFPPFQSLQQGVPAGFDVVVLQQVAQKAQFELELVAGRWDDIVARARLGQFDCVTGMEITPARQAWFEFSRPYYQRHGDVFVLQQSGRYRELGDLVGAIVAGDRDSVLERELSARGIKKSIRVQETPSKEVSMRMLRDGEVAAVVMPDAVAYRLATELGIAIRPLQRISLPGAPVALAVRRGNTGLLHRLDASLAGLLAGGQIGADWHKACPACGVLPAVH